MDHYRAFPYYMGYQGYGQWEQPGFMPEDRILEDMEYLQQMYPAYARKYQSVISSVVDKMDYEGSFIYDQYPDKLTIQRMVSSVMTVIRTGEETADSRESPGDGGTGEGGAAIGRVTKDTLTERAPWNEKEPWIRELVTVLMYYEILTRRKRRQKKRWYL